MPNINKGYFFAILTALISGVSIFLNKFAVEFWNNSSAFTTAKNLGVAIILTLIVLSFERPDFSKISKKDWGSLALVGLIGGSLPFLFFFRGLSMVSAVNSGFIHKTMFLWVAILAIYFLKEKISTVQIGGIIMLGLSIFMMGRPTGMQLGYGELLIFAATLMWAVESVIVQRFVSSISPVILVWGRMFFGSVILLGYLLSQNGITALVPKNTDQSVWLFISIAMLFGYITSFYSAIKYSSATVATSILVMATPITIILNSSMAGTFSPKSLLPLFVALTGIIMFTGYNFLKDKKTVTEKAKI